jgi:hypothetical protein
LFVAGSNEQGGDLAELIAQVFIECAKLDVPTPAAIATAAGGIVLPRALREAANLFGRYADRNTQALMAAERVERRERWAQESARHLAQQLADMMARVQNLEAKLHERVLDPQFGRLVDNYGLEATRESTDERFRMLTLATAGAFDVTMTIAQASRAERTLRELDPEDIALLRKPRAPREINSDATISDDDMSALLASGCFFRERRTRGPGVDQISYERTKLGELVLKVLRAYDPKR